MRRWRPRRARPLELDYYTGLTLTQLGRFEDALLALEKVVNSHFSFLHIMQARMVLGYIYSVTGRYRLAEFEFTKVSELGLQSSQALAALGFVYYAQKESEREHRSAEKGARAGAEERERAELSGLHLCGGEDRPAEGRLPCAGRRWRLRRGTPPISTPWAGLSTASGGFDEARVLFRQALDLAPGNHDIAAHMRAVMEALKDVSSPSAVIRAEEGAARRGAVSRAEGRKARPIAAETAGGAQS